jgi:succinate dehydrogenase / fumarate reductase flavoprotein subunit
VDGLFVAGEANFSDHGANRLGASALMQGLADGYFILPYTVSDYCARKGANKVAPDHQGFKDVEGEARDRAKNLLAVKGERSPDSLHKELGKLLWEHCGMARNETGLRKALSEIPRIRDEFSKNLRVTGAQGELNQTLEKAGRVADFIDFAELLVKDALERKESCGCHLREESQTEEGEPLRDDKGHAHVAAWEWTGPGSEPRLHKEPLKFEHVQLVQRSYK